MREEQASIAQCVDHLASQDWPIEDIEVLVVDGGSDDESVAVARRSLAAHHFGAARVLSGPGPTPANLNLGLAEARGEVVCRVDARSLVPSDYVRRCVAMLHDRPDVAVTGGCQVAVVTTAGPEGEGIARALNNRWGMGLSRYRRGGESGPSDTVYLGAFRTAELRLVGGWDERFPTNQDFELNRRLGRRGVVWVQGDLKVGYLPRTSVAALFAQYRRFGRAKVRYWRLTGDRPRPRQVVLLSAPGVVGVVGLAVTVRSPRAGLVLALLGGGLAVAVEHAGASHPSTGARGHLVAARALAAVSVGWTSGVWTEALRPSGDVEHALEGDLGPLGDGVVHGDLVDDVPLHQVLEHPAEVGSVDPEHGGAGADQRVE
jgi:GT2 family glycosyltransferase